MPPKKDEEEEVKILGRFGTSLRIGIVGLPNVGKSTTFNVLTESHVPAENYPFCTKDPNEARVAVPDEHFDWIVKHLDAKNFTPAYLTVLDVAGLVRGASNGEGLGNAFLSHIGSCDGLYHVARCFDSSDITHVEGEVDPIRDLDIIAQELRSKDLSRVLDMIEKTAKLARMGDKKHKDALELLERIRAVLEDGKDIRHIDWSSNDIDFLNEKLFLTAKPAIYLLNLSKEDYARKKNKWLAKVKAWVDEHDKGAIMIPYSADMELELATMKDDKAAVDAYLAKVGAQSALPKIIKAGYQVLNLQHFFTVGKEVRTWTIQKGTKAPQAAGKIHNDFEKGFIMAEVMSFEDFKEHGSEAAVKAAGKYRQQGRGYTVCDGDIIFFKFNTAGLKK